MKKNQIRLLLYFILMSMAKPHAVFSQNNTIIADNGKVSFSSEAPLELIKASSDKLKGAIDKSKNTFAFAVEIHSFKGFNGDLQREHFHENYMETDKFTTASFSGKLIESVDFNANGTYSVRAKGMFSLHGVQKERIIRGTVVINNEALNIEAMFTVRLEDYDIKVPKIVYEKIAEEIKVGISIKFKQ
jgi:polyisoprenoid-binding protein YceI